MRYFLLLLASLPVFAAEHQGPCARSALAKAMKGQRKAVSEFSLILAKKENPDELHHYEIGFKQGDKFYHGEVSVEYIKGRCRTPVVQYISMLE